jgi:hypothetical protein
VEHQREQEGQLATSRSSISRPFVVGTIRKLRELMGQDLSQLDLPALFIDGIETAKQSD